MTWTGSPPTQPPSAQPGQTSTPPPSQTPSNAGEQGGEIIRIGPPDPVRMADSALRTARPAEHQPAAPVIPDAVPAGHVRPAGSAPPVIVLRGVGLPRVGLPRVGLPRVGLPRVGLPRVGLPRVGLHSVGPHTLGSRRGDPAGHDRQGRHSQRPNDELVAWPGQHGQRRPSNDESPRASLLDLTVLRGELVTITGPAGSGKSALLHVIGLVDRPATGSYLLNGINMAKLGDRDRAALRGRQIGLQFQRPQLLPLRSALDNVLLPLRYVSLPRRQRRAAALAALDRVGLVNHAQVMSGQLSAAERRLVAIARALVTGPSLMLLDDPTASLDSATAARVISLLLSLRRDGTTVLIATDDQLAAAYSSQRVVLAKQARKLDWPAVDPGSSARSAAWPAQDTDLSARR